MSTKSVTSAPRLRKYLSPQSRLAEAQPELLSTSDAPPFPCLSILVNDLLIDQSLFSSEER